MLSFLDMWSSCHLLAFIILGQDTTTCFSLYQAKGVLPEKKKCTRNWIKSGYDRMKDVKNYAESGE